MDDPVVTTPVAGGAVGAPESVGNGIASSDGFVGEGPGGVNVTVSLPAVRGEIVAVSITVAVSP